jgi:hypothetical protein
MHRNSPSSPHPYRLRYFGKIFTAAYIRRYWVCALTIPCGDSHSSPYSPESCVTPYKQITTILTRIDDFACHVPRSGYECCATPWVLVQCESASRRSWQSSKPMLLILLTEFATFESERAVGGKLKRRVTLSKVNFCRRKYNQHMLCAIAVWRHFRPVGRRHWYPMPNSSPSRFQGQASPTGNRFNVPSTRNVQGLAPFLREQVTFTFQLIDKV